MRKVFLYAYAETRVGKVVVAAGDKGLAAVLLSDSPLGLRRELGRALPAADLIEDAAALAGTFSEVVLVSNAPRHRGRPAPVSAGIERRGGGVACVAADPGGRNPNLRPGREIAARRRYGTGHRRRVCGHGFSKLRAGRRHTLGIIFYDAA